MNNTEKVDVAENKEEAYKRFVSYFQKVVTVGVLTTHKKYEDAELEAKIIFNSEEPEKCFFDETDWELTDTVVYDPPVETDFVPTLDGQAVNMSIIFNKEMREKIAEAFEKNVSELTEDDISKFVRLSLENKMKENV